MPRRGVTPTAASTVVAHRWFVAVRLVERRHVAGEVQLVPASTTHAKRMGTNATACGVNTSSWHKLWERRFTGAGIDVCRSCVDTVTENDS